jgi:hypothetical protein
MGAIDPGQPEIRLKQALLSLEEEYVNPPFAFFGAVG